MTPLTCVLLAWLAIYPLVPGRHGHQWAVHLVAVAAAGVVLVPRMLRARRLRVGVPFACTALCLVSLAIAVAAADGFPARELRDAAATGLAHAVFFLLCLFAAPRAGDEDEGARARALLALLLLAMLVGQLGALLLAAPPDAETSWRPSGTLGNPNAFGAFVVAAALALAALGRWRPWVLVALAPLALVVLRTRSRGAAAAGLVVGAAFLARRFGWKAPVALALAGALVLLVPNPLSDRLRSMEPEHTFDRTFLWAAAARASLAAPAGIGPAMNKYVFPRHAYDPERPWLLHQRHTVGLTHNVFLTLALEWGWLAGVSALALTAWAARRLLRHGVRDPLGEGALLGAAVLFVELQVDGVEQNPLVFALFLLLLAVAIARRAPARGVAVRDAPAPAGAAGGVAVPAPAGAAATLLVACGLVALAVDRQLDRARLDAALAAVEAAAPGGAPDAAADAASAAAGAAAVPFAVAPHARDGVRALLERAAAAAPGDPEPARLRFEVERAIVKQRLAAIASEHAAPPDASPAARAALAGQRVAAAVADPELLEASAAALAAMERARAANPRDVTLPRQAAAFAQLAYRELGRRASDLDAYFAHMEDVLALDPLDVGARFAVALEADRAGRLALRDEQLAEIVRLEPDDAWAWLVVGRLHETDGEPGRALYCYVRAEEALLNCHLQAQVGNPRARAFYETAIERVDRRVLRAHIARLRRQLYR